MYISTVIKQEKQTSIAILNPGNEWASDCEWAQIFNLVNATSCGLTAARVHVFLILLPISEGESRWHAILKQASILFNLTIVIKLDLLGKRSGFPFQIIIYRINTSWCP